MQGRVAMQPRAAAAQLGSRSSVPQRIQGLQLSRIALTAELRRIGSRHRGVERSVTTCAEQKSNTGRESAALRAEVEAPFRLFRLGLYGCGILGAGLATLFGLPTLIGALAGAPNAKPLLEAAADQGINVGSLAVSAWLFSGDYAAREKQIERLTREEALGECRLELASGKLLRLAQLRGFARVVLFAGTTPQVLAALAEAEPFKADLVERGVLVVGLPIYDARSDDAAPIPALQKDDLKWRAVPIRLDDWKAWFARQVELAGKTGESGLYISLRKDGRVRGSGSGSPPWGRFVAQLPPDEGFFGGLFDGMDGKV